MATVEALEALADMGTDDLLDPRAVARTLHLPGTIVDLDASVQPEYRLLARIPRLPESVIGVSSGASAACRRSCGLRSTTSTMWPASASSRARAIKEGLLRLTDRASRSLQLGHYLARSLQLLGMAIV